MFCKLKPGFVVVSTCVNPDQTPRMLSPAKLSKSSGGAPSSGAPGSGAPGYDRTWVHLLIAALSRCGLELFFRFFASHTQVPESAKKSHPLRSALLAQRRGAAPCGAVRCRALPCPAVLCRAVPCCAMLCFTFSFVHTDDSAINSKHTGLARASMSPSILYSSVDPSFSIFLKFFF